MAPHTSTPISASQLTSRCSTQNWARPPDSTLVSTCFDIGRISFQRLLRSRAVGGDFDGRAVIQETSSRGDHLLARPQPLGNENRAVENIAGLHGSLHRLAVLDHKDSQLRWAASGRTAI